MASVNILNPKDDIDNYDYRDQGSPFRQLLWYCSGADVRLLMRCPQSERIKKEGIGGIVLATGGLAFISGSYAFYTVFSTGSFNSGDDLNLFAVLKAIIFGLMWAFVIFNLDRFIVSSVSHGDGTSSMTWREIGQALPRIFMAVIIGLCLSKPLEIRVMKSEIEYKLFEKQEELQKTGKAKADLKFEELKKVNEARFDEVTKKEAKFIFDIDKKRSEISEQEATMNKEREGGRGNGKGIGENYRAAEKLRNEKITERDFLQSRYDEAKLGIEEEKKRLKTDLDNLIANKQLEYKNVETKSRGLDGLVERITVAETNYPVPSLILSLLLIIIEVSPIILKMMLEDGPYDRLVENQRKLSEARYAIEVHQTIDSETNKVVMGHTNHQAEILSSYEIGNLKVQRELTEKIQESYLKSTIADIEKNPDKYIERGENTRSTG
jgi:hypothetical protein